MITGASAGIGAAFAAEFAGHGHALVLVARSRARLESLAQELRDQYGVAVAVIDRDLAEPGAAQRLQEDLETAGLQPLIVVNNAGMAASGAFKAQSVEAGESMVRLNIEALTGICRLLLPPMLAAGYGRILNVASVAAFQPIPAMATYAASKAYVLSLSEALGEELQGSGVQVSCLCPGLTDTGMAADMVGLANSGGEQLPRLVMSTPAKVAAEGYTACMGGQPIRVPGAVNQLATLWSQTQPRWLVRGLGGIVGRQLLRRQ